MHLMFSEAVFAPSLVSYLLSGLVILAEHHACVAKH